MTSQIIDRIIRLPEVIHRSGMKKTALYASIKRGDFPAPIKNGRMSGWSEKEVQAWIARKMESRLAA